jgi:hypothetical protein
MRKRTMSLGGALLALLLASVFLATAASHGSAAQGAIGGGVNVTPSGKTKPTGEGITVGRSYHNDVSRPVRSMPARTTTLPRGEAAENPSLFKEHLDKQDGARQSSAPTGNMPDPILNFDGIPFPGVVCNCAPPDTNGEVGLDQYVQIVNEGFQVFDKNTGTSVFGPVAISSLWNGFGGLCENNGFGDPVVLYDQLANRWVITQFAGLLPITDECIAVSTSSDASGSYARYGFHLGEDFFDYPHFGVWPDAYYMSMNVFNSSGTAFLGPQAFAFDRTAMLAGNPATIIFAPRGGPTDDAFLPADLDGMTPPPAGAPNPYVSVGTLATWPVHRFHVDFANPANSTWTVAGTLTPAPFTVLCPFTRACVPQAGSGDGLDAIGDRGMFRSAYRNFGDHEALVGNMTVSSGGVAGIRWFELNNATSGTPGFVQESTYQPDNTWRWMGSAAMDGNGNLALGYSASSATINPQIRYAGRLASDPPGQLTQAEVHLFDGTGSQLDTVNRWGDYSDMTVDPVDDCTFWYTQEYYQTTSSFNWRTRIGNFKFPSCTAAPHGTLEGTVTDAGTSDPIAGAHVSVTPLGASTTTGPDGHYSLTLPVDTYTVTASAFGYNTASQSAAVTDGGTTTVNFALTAAPTGSLSGTVSENNGNPLANGTVTILGTPIPPTTTDASGHYSFASVPNGTYNVKAEAGRCNTAQTDSVTVSGSTTHDFTLPQRTDSFGYSCRVETAAYIEGDTALGLSGDDSFTSVSLPFSFSLYGASYGSANVCTNGYISFTGGNCVFTNTGIPNSGLPNGAIYPYWDDLIVDGSSSMWTKTLTSPNRFVIEWRNATYFGDSSRRIDFEVVLYENGQILTQYRNIADDARERGSSATLGLENEDGSVAFQYSSNEAVVGTPEYAIRYLLPPSGFVQGTVTDDNDDNALAGVTVKALQGANTVRQTATDASGFYRMQVPVGSYTIEASKTNYETGSADVTIAEDQTVTQDFSLRTARGEVDPTSLEFVLQVNQTQTKTLRLSNTGSLPMTWEVKESGGGIAAPATATAGLKRNPDYNPNARTTKNLYVGETPAGARSNAPGDILRQWGTGLSLGWGVGYDGDVWLSDVDGGTCGPSCTNNKFAVTGPPPIASFANGFAGSWAGDMALMGPNEMCQVNVGGDNGIYCWDTSTGTQTRHISGAFPWTGISQRGLAYRPDDDSFYIGGWNEGILYHVAGFSHPAPGAVLNQCNAPDFNISGLAWNAAVGQVWEATNSPTDTIYRVDPTTCAAVSTLPHPRPGFNGAGLEMDENGNLWMIAQDAGPNTAYLIDSGVPAFSDVPWLSESPTEGTINPGGHTDIAVTVDTTGLAPGSVYQATLTFRTNSGRQPNLSVPVRLVVPKLGFNSGGGSYTAVGGDPWLADRAYTAANKAGYVQSPPRTVSTNSAIAGTDDDPLYQKARITAMTYRFSGLPNFVYRLELKFAEIENKSPGQRQFDVIVNGQPYLIAFDIAALAGRNTALDRTTLVSPINGEITVQLATRRSTGVPILNAIRVARDH